MLAACGTEFLALGVGFRELSTGVFRLVVGFKRFARGGVEEIANS